MSIRSPGDNSLRAARSGCRRTCWSWASCCEHRAVCDNGIPVQTVLASPRKKKKKRSKEFLARCHAALSVSWLPHSSCVIMFIYKC